MDPGASIMQEERSQSGDLMEISLQRIPLPSQISGSLAFRQRIVDILPLSETVQRSSCILSKLSHALGTILSLAMAGEKFIVNPVINCQDSSYKIEDRQHCYVEAVQLQMLSSTLRCKQIEGAILGLTQVLNVRSLVHIWGSDGADSSFIGERALPLWTGIMSLLSSRVEMQNEQCIRCSFNDEIPENKLIALCIATLSSYAFACVPYVLKKIKQNSWYRAILEKVYPRTSILIAKSIAQDENLMCAICYEVYASIGSRVKLECGHCFCVPCLGQWLHSDQTNFQLCPHCRRGIKNDDYPLDDLLSLFKND